MASPIEQGRSEETLEKAAILIGPTGKNNYRSTQPNAIQKH
jgi:hypothetical protein